MKFHKLILIAVFGLLCTQINAQTKLIAHKSHGGTNENFQLALANALFNPASSGFGENPYMKLRLMTRLDSVILDADSVMYIVIREQRTSEFDIQNAVPAAWKRKVYTGSSYSHLAFRNGYSVEERKNFLLREPTFENPVDSVKFIQLSDIKIRPEGMK